MSPAPTTVLEALAARLRAAAEPNRQIEVPPAVVLWTDDDRQWAPLVPRLQAVMPELLVLDDDYRPEDRRGPSIWLRCVVDRKIAVPGIAPAQMPILYLGGVGRPELRTLETCPPALQRIADLQFRGTYFSHPNGKDWTITAFLGSPQGLGLDLSPDAETLSLVRQAIVPIAELPLAEMRGLRLDAERLQQLLSPDFEQGLLRWLDDPEGVRRALAPADWEVFRTRCGKRFRFDPEKDGPLVAADRLVLADGHWASVWRRFEEAPDRYPGIPARLERATLPLFTNEDLVRTSPRVHRQRENELRERLRAVGELAAHHAAEEVLALEEAHARRRGGIWARLGQAPLALALQPLAELARGLSMPPGEPTIQALGAAYCDGGWGVDVAVLDALAIPEQRVDVEAVVAVIRALYRPWLEERTLRFQEAVGREGYPRPSAPPAPVAGDCILFADGLRFDLGRRLERALAARGALVHGGWRWSPAPTVTATAKPLVAPIAASLAGDAGTGEFQPSLRTGGRPLTTDLFRRLLADAGIEFIPMTQMGDPAGRGWTEFGDIDRYGHEHGWKTARYVERQLRELADRIEELLAAGWMRVRVVTDHGWLLLPGGLPRCELHVSLGQPRWARCARLRPDASPGLQTVPWHWNPEVAIAIAPGIGSFYASTEYSHGGLSLQECVVPELEVTLAARRQAVVIKALRWLKLRCRVTVEPADPTWRIDLRRRPADPATSVAELVKPLGADGTASVPARDDVAGEAAVVVVVDASGTVLASQATTIGGEEA